MTQKIMRIIEYLFIEINPFAKIQIDLPNILIGAFFGGIVGYYLVKIIEWSHRVKLKFLGFTEEIINFGKLLKLKFILKGQFEPGVCCCEIVIKGKHHFAKWDETPNPLKGDELNEFIPEMVPATYYQNLFKHKEYLIPILIQNNNDIQMFNGWWFGKDSGYGDFVNLNDNDNLKIIIRGNNFSWSKDFKISEIKKFITSHLDTHSL